MVQIRLFGDFEIVADDQPIAPIRSERRRALLAYLIVHHKVPQPRQSVAFTLWPQSSESQARTNLRKELHRLRKEQPAVEDLLEIDTDLLVCRPTATCSADVIEFDHSLHCAAKAADPALAADHLQHAVALYQGDFFPQSYENWALATRERLRSDCIGALDQLIDFHTAQQGYSEAILYLRQLLQVEPLREETYRRMMRVHALNNDLGGVYHTFQRCRDRLAQELHAEPSEPTIDLYHQLHQQHDPAAPNTGFTSSRLPARAVTNLPSMHPRSSGTAPEQSAAGCAAASKAQLIGRAAQWRQLEEMWQQVQDHRPHQPQCLLIRGGSGMGKTTLVSAFMAAVRERNGTAIYAQTTPATHPPAYGPVTDWLRSGLFAAQLRTLQRIWRAELSVLLPELPSAMSDLHTALDAATSHRYSHLLDALCALLQQVKQPLLLVLDGLQWCDTETLDWLQMVLTGASPLPILLLVTARTDELHTASAAKLWCLRLREAQRLQELDLPLLDQAQTAMLTNLLLDKMPTHSPAHSVTTEEIYRLTEGHPQIIEELIGVLAQPPFHRRYHVSPLALSPDRTTLPIPMPKTDAAIAVQLAQRSSAAQAVLGMVAAIGPPVTLAQLLSLADGESAMVLDALDELMATGLLREERNGTYTFIHGRVRQIVQARLSQARRRFYQQRLQHLVGFP